MMNITKFTQKSVEILNSLEKIAYDFGAQEIVQEHLLYGMLTIEDSLLKKLIEKMEIDSDGTTGTTVRLAFTLTNGGGDEETIME